MQMQIRCEPVQIRSAAKKKKCTYFEIGANYMRIRLKCANLESGQIGREYDEKIKYHPEISARSAPYFLG